MFDKDEYNRWIMQAKDTLESATQDFQNDKYNWCCFKAQQAAEYAVKGLLYGLGSIPSGHSITRLVRILKRRGTKITLNYDQLLKNARHLDRHYIPTRYPNAHAEGAPFEYYDKSTAQEALNIAKATLKVVEEVSKRWVGRK